MCSSFIFSSAINLGIILPGKTCPAHEQKECQANLALETFEPPEERQNAFLLDHKPDNFGVFIGQELNVILYLTTTLSSPWSAFGVVIPTYHKVVHKARGWGVGHD